MELTLKTPTHITQANNFYLIYLRYVKIDSYCLPSKKKYTSQDIIIQSSISFQKSLKNNYAIAI